MSRDSLDRYYTPDALAFHLVGLVANRIGGGMVLEPSCGGGAFLRALEAHDIEPVLGIDIDPAAVSGQLDDFLAARLPINYYSAVIGNPPYSLAVDFVRKSLELVEDRSASSDGGIVAFLLRLGFLASKGRAALFREHPPSDVFILSERPSFTADGKTDRYDYCFVVWTKGNKQPTQMRWI